MNNQEQNKGVEREGDLDEDWVKGTNIAQFKTIYKTLPLNIGKFIFAL